MTGTTNVPAIQWTDHSPGLNVYGLYAPANTLDPRGAFLRSDGESAIGLDLSRATGLYAWAVPPNNVPLPQLNAAGSAQLGLLTLDGANALAVAPDPAITGVNIGNGTAPVAINGVQTPIWYTPGSKTAACTQGQIAIDATYLYTCVTTGVAGSAIWDRTAKTAW